MNLAKNYIVDVQPGTCTIVAKRPIPKPTSLLEQPAKTRIKSKKTAAIILKLAESVGGIMVILG